MLSRWKEEQEKAAMEYRRRAELLEAERQRMLYDYNIKKEMENVKSEDNSLEDFKELNKNKNKNKKGKTI